MMSRKVTKTQSAVTLTALVMLSAGCTTDPYTGEEKPRKAATGAAIGAAAGGLIGVISGDDSRERRKRALIGAGVGALGGAAVGHYMDLQEDKLREQLRGTGVSVTRVEDDIILNMPGNVTFDTDRAEIRSGFYSVLNSVSLVLKEFEKTIIIVNGHTDSTGSQSYNQRLSEERAASVGAYLTSQGVAQMRVMTAGFGETRPIATNDTPEGRQLNRRVELTLAPLT